MKLYTNKFALIAGYPCIQVDGTIKDQDKKIQFDEGTIFKVVGVTQVEFLLESGGKSVLVNQTIFDSAFKETEIEI